MYAFFPLVWSSGDEPSDGCGGAAVGDPGTIYVCLEEEDEFEAWDEMPDVLLKTSLTEMVEEFIDDGREGGNGVTHALHAPLSDRLAAHFRALADLLDAAKTMPK